MGIFQFRIMVHCLNYHQVIEKLKCIALKEDEVLNASLLGENQLY